MRLLDQNDVPVPDALFQCALSGYRFVADRVRHRQKIRVRTDADGRASFVIAPVSWCDSFGADKAGYVYDMDDNAALYGKKPATGARDMRAPLLQLLASSRAAPTVVRLVNRGKLTLPFGRLESVEVPLRGAPDNNEGTTAPLFTAEFPKERVWNGALVFTATTDAGGETFTLKIKTGDVTGGLVLSPKVLLEAPDSGYQAQATLSLPTPTKGKSSWLRPRPLVYFRTGSPVLYGRLLLREVADLGEQSGTRMIRLSCSTNLNAFGGRAVEPIEHRAITGDNGNAVYGMLDEARRTLAAGKVPPEPDWRVLLDVHAPK